MKRFLGVSLILHTIVFCWLTFKKEVVQQDVIEIETKEAPPPTKKNPEGPGSGPKRIGNGGEGLGDLPLGDRLTVENYILRIKELIEPVWISKVKERIKFRQKAKFGKVSCKTTIIIIVNSSGLIEKTNLVYSCRQDLAFDKIALGVWDRNLPPPPKNLLENGILEIAWTFVIR